MRDCGKKNKKSILYEQPTEKEHQEWKKMPEE